MGWTPNLRFAIQQVQLCKNYGIVDLSMITRARDDTMPAIILEWGLDGDVVAPCFWMPLRMFLLSTQGSCSSAIIALSIMWM